MFQFLLQISLFHIGMNWSAGKYYL